MHTNIEKVVSRATNFAVILSNFTDDLAIVVKEQWKSARVNPSANLFFFKQFVKSNRQFIIVLYSTVCNHYSTVLRSLQYCSFIISVQFPFHDIFSGHIYNNSTIFFSDSFLYGNDWKLVPKAFQGLVLKLYHIRTRLKISVKLCNHATEGNTIRTIQVTSSTKAI